MPIAALPYEDAPLVMRAAIYAGLECAIERDTSVSRLTTVEVWSSLKGMNVDDIAATMLKRFKAFVEYMEEDSGISE